VRRADIGTPWRRARRTCALLGAAAAAWSRGTAAEPAPRRPDAHGSFVDAAGRTQPFGATYDAWFGAARRPPHRLRAVTEIAILYALGFAYYVVDPLSNSRDFYNPSFANKLTFRELQFDADLNTTNHLLHPIAGALSYNLARNNGLGVAESFAYSFVPSFIEAWLLEFHNRSSINDMIFTPSGGAPLGEFFFRLGDYLDSARGHETPTQKLLASTLGIFRRAHAAVDHEPPPPPAPRDSLGYTTAYWHEFALAYRPTMVQNDLGASGVLHDLIVQGELIAIPGHLRPGRFATTFFNGNFTDLRAHLALGPEGLDEAGLWSSATWLGHYAQAFEPSGRGVRGAATMIGIGSALEFGARSTLNRRDQVSVAHLIGPMSNIWLSHGDLTARFTADVHVDFAGIRSLAYEAWQARYGSRGLKTILPIQGYTFDAGISARARVRVDYRGFELVGYASFGAYGSIEGHDRQQESVTLDLHGTEQVFTLDALLGYQPVGMPFFGRLGASQIWRASTFGPFVERRWDRGLSLTAGLRF